MNRNELKRAIFESQGWKCWVEDCPYPALHLHEAIITKGDVQGSSDELKAAINHLYNCIGLCRAHHNTALEPKAIDVYNWMVEQHGQQVVEWVAELAQAFKVVPGRLKEILNEIDA